MILLQLEDAEYLTTPTKKYSNRRNYVAGNDKCVVSAIPGTILDVCVAEGQSVKRGECLCILDSMKMNNQILAPMDGKIKKISVEVGQSIGKNVVMVEFF